MEVDHGIFTPLVFTTTGVMSHERTIFYKCLAQKLNVKKNERCEEIVRYMRVKFSFLAPFSAQIYSCFRSHYMNMIPCAKRCPCSKVNLTLSTWIEVSKSHEVDCDFVLTLNDLRLL